MSFQPTGPIFISYECGKLCRLHLDLLRSNYNVSLITDHSAFTLSINMFFLIQITYPDTDHILMAGVNRVMNCSQFQLDASWICQDTRHKV